MKMKSRKESILRYLVLFKGLNFVTHLQPTAQNSSKALDGRLAKFVGLSAIVINAS
jgi:hypothetical protein